MLVYFDMDGVLTAFDEAYDRLVGQRQANGDVLWEKVAEHPFFFRDLKPMPRMQELWNLAPEGQRRILSAVPKSIEASDPQKRQWLQTHLGIAGDDVIFVHGKEHKCEYSRPGDILVDDWRVNIDDWTSCGGTAVWYRTPEQAIDELAGLLARAPGKR